LPSKRGRRRTKKSRIPHRLNILYRFVECVDCRNRYCNGIKGLVIDVTKTNIKILTIFGDIVIIPIDECRYYVRINNREFLVNSRQIAK